MDQGVLLLVGGGVVVIGFGVYLFLRSAKGGVVIKLQKLHADSGETFTGTVEILAKQEIQATRFFVALVYDKPVRSHTGVGQRNRRRTETIHTSSVVLVKNETFKAGFSYTYPFELLIPTASAMGQYGGSDWNPADGAIEMLMGSPWRIRAVVEATGIDLSGSVDVFVNLKNA